MKATKTERRQVDDDNDNDSDNDDSNKDNDDNDDNNNNDDDDNNDDKYENKNEEFETSAEHPYPVVKLWWGEPCPSPIPKVSMADLIQTHKTQNWHVVMSADWNANYLAFLPSVMDFWSSRGLQVSIGLVEASQQEGEGKDQLRRAISELGAQKVTVFFMPHSNATDLPTGHAGKIARAYMAATQFPPNDLVTIVDMDYYLFWWDQWKSYLSCVPAHGIFGRGYNLYHHTNDEGKFPMYLATAQSKTFAQFLQTPHTSSSSSFGKWLHGFRQKPLTFDEQESPFGFSSEGGFSDESLFRAQLHKLFQSRRQQPTPEHNAKPQQQRRGQHKPWAVYWLNQPPSWHRIDRSERHCTVTDEELNQTADVFPNRPLAKCDTFRQRILPVWRHLNICNLTRTLSFLRLLQDLKIPARHWGTQTTGEGGGGAIQEDIANEELDCIARLTCF